MASRPWTSPRSSGTSAEEPDRGATAVQFYVLAFALSWTVWGMAVLFPDLQDVVGPLIILGAYGPFVAALLIAGRREGAWCWFRRVARPKGRWRLILLGGLALPLLIATAHLVTYTLLFAGVSASSDPPWYWTVAAAPVNIGLLFWLGSGMEEFGWQGMGVPALMQRFRPLTTAVVHGIAWGTWHLPLYLIDSWSGDDQSVLALYGITLTLSPIMIWLTRSAAGGVLPAVLFHTATNHYSSLYMDQGDNGLFAAPLADSFDIIKIGVYLTIAAAVIVTTRGRLLSNRLAKPATS